MISITLVVVGVGLAFVLGMHAGRTAERREFAAGRNPVRTQRLAEYEAELRRKRGAPRMHPDPENAGIQRQARIHR